LRCEFYGEYTLLFEEDSLTIMRYMEKYFLSKSFIDEHPYLLGENKIISR